ncbi:hypothetical protein A359_02250 [secondary endosymbiont of Ctenarytaina eucalypti]|uniref:Uncharacterized protein n=1 Tax=secondary endosymbiont of Ctenarytaina eucalypti TaxID=1199245 RepID=J3VRM8_9ENTR|nr:hypothetical protein A359_02250 [secondary endosymbiont of Ctenarytaina eucalypti]
MYLLTEITPDTLILSSATEEDNQAAYLTLGHKIVRLHAMRLMMSLKINS